MLGSILIFLLVLSILVIVHELGHFVVAKRNGILVEEFGFGLPPRIWGKKIGETLYSLNLLPFGGFVKLHGELTEDNIVEKDRAFLNKSKKVKIMVLIDITTCLSIELIIYVFGSYDKYLSKIICANVFLSCTETSNHSISSFFLNQVSWRRI